MPEFVPALGVGGELEEGRSEGASVAGRHEDAPAATAEERRDIAEIRGYRAEAGCHVLDHLQRREVETFDREIGRDADVPATKLLDRVGVAERTECPKPAGRQIG